MDPDIVVSPPPSVLKRGRSSSLVPRRRLSDELDDDQASMLDFGDGDLIDEILNMSETFGFSAEALTLLQTAISVHLPSGVPLSTNWFNLDGRLFSDLLHDIMKVDTIMTRNVRGMNTAVQKNTRSKRIMLFVASHLVPSDVAISAPRFKGTFLEWIVTQDTYDDYLTRVQKNIDLKMELGVTPKGRINTKKKEILENTRSTPQAGTQQARRIKKTADLLEAKRRDERKAAGLPIEEENEMDFE